VRFPGDWFGPPEELVPFGSTADAAAAPSALTPSDPGLATDGRLGSGEDFWSERAAAWHAPVPTVRGEETTAGKVPATPLAGPASSTPLGGPASSTPLAGSVASAPRRSRRRAAVAALAIATAALATVVTGFGGSPGPPSATVRVSLTVAGPIKAALAGPLRVLAQIRLHAPRPKATPARRLVANRVDKSTAIATARFVPPAPGTPTSSATTQVQTIPAAGDFASSTATAIHQASPVTAPPAPDAAGASATLGGPPPP
jgi:hypothetical protein